MNKSCKLKVKLLHHTADAEVVVSMAARLCYSSLDIEGLSDKISKSSQADYVKKISELGHLSTFEHVTFTFGIEGVSRALTHQLVRHRIASFSQQSQRYVGYKEAFKYIKPQSIADNLEAKSIFDKMMTDINDGYSRLIELGIPAEDARFLLPNATESKIIVTMNARELLHFFALRSCNRAQWEIRAMSDAMIKLAYNVAPAIFAGAGPSCVTGGCSEGKFNCGKSAEVRKHISELKAGFDPKEERKKNRDELIPKK